MHEQPMIRSSRPVMETGFKSVYHRFRGALMGVFANYPDHPRTEKVFRNSQSDTLGAGRTDPYANPMACHARPGRTGTPQIARMAILRGSGKAMEMSGRQSARAGEKVSRRDFRKTEAHPERSHSNGLCKYPVACEGFETSPSQTMDIRRLEIRYLNGRKINV